MIGFYNYSVILTYIGLASAIFGMTQASDGRFSTAIICLVLSGACDMFDGKVARAMKKRTEEEKAFGIQIDSLCDLVCFGVFPAFLGYCMGVNTRIGTTILILYVLAAVIRLGYFNVMEEKRQKETMELRKEYQGLPVTTIAILFPIFFVLKEYVGTYYTFSLHLFFLFVAVLFVADIRVKKPTGKITAGLTVAGILILAKVLRFI